MAIIPASASLPYRPGVGIMLVNDEGKVFVGKRLDMTSEAWQMPQGGVDAGESPFVAAKRELKEETGTDKAEPLAESRDWYSYDLPENLIPQIWGGRFRGQKQKWFLMRFTGKDGDINIHTENPEFTEWKWAEPKMLPSLIVPFKKKLYADLVREFSAYL
jgi:putative (di)nucleoside polyphosphate hydrolase